MPAFSAAAVTRLHPNGLPGEPFGSFAGKSPAGTSPRGPGNYTWLSPMATPGRKYDFTLFASKTAAATTTVRPFEGLRRHTGRLMH